MSPGPPIAVDAMGGDHAPAAVVAGARTAAAHGAPVVLVGAARVVEASGLPFVVATEAIGMDEEPGRAVRTRKDASVVRAAELVRDGAAAAMVGAGNTGATMAAALFRMGRLRGIRRPAIAAVVPSPTSGRSTVVLDVGANVEITAEMAVQFAQIGGAYARSLWGLERPRVALLNIGEEAGKGHDAVRECSDALSEAAWQERSGVVFAGNAEGRDLMWGTYDVVVTDGFTGNVALKSMEGATTQTLAAVVRQLGGLPAELEALAEILDPGSHGGAALLGVNGVCVVAHGASDDKAICRAIWRAVDLVERGVVAKVATATVGDPRRS